MEKYDVVFIGSGLGSLLCAYILGKEGYKVCVLEQHDQIGGNLQSFKRKGFTFETGMHYIGSMDPGQILHQFFKYFDLLDKVELERLNEDGFDVLIHKNKEYKYPMGIERFIETMCGYFPNERKGIVKYIRKLEEVAHSQSIFRLDKVDTEKFSDNPYMRQSAYEFIKSCTKDLELQNVLSGLNFLYAGDQNKTPLYIHALVNWFYLQSAWGFKKGSFQVAEELAASIRSFGGTFQTKSKVTALIESGNKITHAEVNGKDQIAGDLFISGIHPTNTIELTNSHFLKKSYRNRIKTLENSMGCFSIYMVMKENAFTFYNNNFHFHDSETVWGVNEYSSKNWPVNYWMYTPINGKQNQYARTLSLLSYMSIEEVRPWENTNLHNRGSEYRQFKKDKAERLIDIMEIKWPHIREGIDSYYTATPLTFRDYTGTPDGSVYGVTKNYNHPSASIVLPKTGLKNLLLTGQNTNIHGFLGVVFGSLMTCGKVIDINHILKSIRNA